MKSLVMPFLVFVCLAREGKTQSIPIMVADLLPHLMEVESNHDPLAVGDKGRALGILQIWDVVIEDVRRITRRSDLIHTDAYDVQTAQFICVVYLTHYGKHYESTTGKTCTYEVLARMWNGGPYGYTKQSTDRYWIKVMRSLHGTVPVM